MYHTVKIGEIDQHTHRFLWRDMKTDVDPDVYVMTVVSFGDKCAGNIAIMALRKTAEMGQNQYPEAAKIVLDSSYIDDICDSVENIQVAKQRTKEIDKLLEPGAFRIKKWNYTSAPNTQSTFEHRTSENAPTTEHDNDPDKASTPPLSSLLQQDDDTTKDVLGMKLDGVRDEFRFNVCLNLTPKRKRAMNKIVVNEINEDTPLTKRMILSQVNRMFDPLGLVGPFILRAKLLMRKVWAELGKELDWDDVIPKENMIQWMAFFRELPLLKGIFFPRCVKPLAATGNPSLVIFCDGGNDAFGACAYVRWETSQGVYHSQLLMSKNRLTPPSEYPL